MNIRTLDEIILDPKEFAFYTGYAFRGLTISESGVGYNIVLRAYDSNGEAVYAMTQEGNAHEGLSQLLEALSSPVGSTLWRRDKYHRSNG